MMEKKTHWPDVLEEIGAYGRSFIMQIDFFGQEEVGEGHTVVAHVYDYAIEDTRKLLAVMIWEALKKIDIPQNFGCIEIIHPHYRERFIRRSA